MLADSLEKSSMHRDHRNLLLEGQLVLISPYDPAAGFNVGNAMQRNKVVYALADAALVVSSDLNKGGTWAGAKEQLDKLHLVPVYVRSTGAASPGLEALRDKGASPWPNPRDVDSFESILAFAARSADEPQPGLPVLPDADPSAAIASPHGAVSQEPETSSVMVARLTGLQSAPASASPAVRQVSGTYMGSVEKEAEPNPAEILFALVRELASGLAKAPMKDTEFAASLNVSTAQAKTWLQRLIDEGVLEKSKKPVTYTVTTPGVFDHVR